MESPDSRPNRSGDPELLPNTERSCRRSPIRENGTELNIRRQAAGLPRRKMPGGDIPPSFRQVYSACLSPVVCDVEL